MSPSSRSTLKTQKVSPGKLTDKQPSNNRSTSSRSRSSIRSLGSRASMYVKHAPGWSNLKRQQLVPRRTSTHESVSSLTTPEMLKRNNSGSSGEPSDTTSTIEFLSAFHFLSSDIASSREEIIALALSDKFGVDAAPPPAADLVWALGQKLISGRFAPFAFSQGPIRDGYSHRGQNDRSTGSLARLIVS